MEAGHNVTSRSEKTEGIYDGSPRDEHVDTSIPGGDAEVIAV